MKIFKFKISNLKFIHRVYFINIKYIRSYSYRYKGTLEVDIMSAYINIRFV